MKADKNICADKPLLGLVSERRGAKGETDVKTG